MKNLILIIVTGLICANAFSQTPELNDEEILQAMRDEIKRSMDELYIESLDRPYYIEYKVVVGRSFQVSSELGNHLDTDDQFYARLSVDVRVGDYKFDNSNFFDFGLSFFGSSDDEESFRNRPVAIEPDYESLRRNLWLATDAAYKQAAEIYSKKVAFLKSRNRKDTTHDFLRVEPKKIYNKRELAELNVEKIKQLTNAVSGVFKKYPEIQRSTVGMEYLPKIVYMVNSEGREYIKTEYYSGLEIVAFTQADDGMPLANYFTAQGMNPEDIPSKDSLISAAVDVAQKLSELRNSQALYDPYSGPIVFEDEAAAQIVAQVFAPNLAVQRAPLMEGGFADNERFAAFQTKIGGRVLPEFLSVKAVPLQDKFENTQLVGTYKFDDDGIKAENIDLVIDGYLKALLSTRVPNKRVRESNGHKRGGAAMISNILFEANDNDKIKSYKEQVNRMIELCQDRELEYGIVIRKILDQNILFTTLLRITAGEFPFNAMGSKIPLIEAYKIYPDGREELIRGVQLKGLTVQSFKDIIAASEDKYTMNYLAPAISSPFVTGGSQFIGASIIAPDLLFEDAEIVGVEEDYPKPPITQNPLMD